jgi:tRNA nucleotidyltransferase (CCA-adding enzyme)
MDSKITKILNKIEQHGFEAYIVGGYVRDYIMGNESTDVDICTNALPKDVINIFEIKCENTDYGSIHIKDNKYNFDITTYRSESNYNKRKPQTIEYVDNLLIDIKRRDFTINSLCMNSKGQVIDLLNGKADILDKKIKVIGDVNQKLTEDPLRILRAIRFAATLDFELDSSIIEFINKNKVLIKTLSYNRKKEELDRIFSSKNILIGINLLKELELLDVLDINYDRITIVPDILGIWSQISFSDRYPFTKSSLNTIKEIRKILDMGEVTNETLYKEGLYISVVAGQILGITKEEINKRFNDLVIHSKEELAINSKDIIEILNINPSNKIKFIYDDVLSKVLNNIIGNNYDEIKKYLLMNWK